MNKQEVIYKALDTLEKNTRIKGKWVAFDRKETDGQLILIVDNQKTKHYVQIKNELRNHQLQPILAINQKYAPIMVVATHLFPKIKEELRQNNIGYLEANGNIYLKIKETILWIDTNKPIDTDNKKSTRAFTKTGLKVVFQFLVDENWVNKPYRKIAEQTGTGIGNITNIILGLKQDGFLIPIAKNEYKLNNKK